MNGVSLLPLEYKLIQIKKQKNKQYLEKVVLASVVIFGLLVFSSIFIFATSQQINSLDNTNSEITKQISLYGDYKPVLNDINSSTAKVNAAIGTYPDMLWLVSEVAKATPKGVSIGDIAIKYDGKEGTCTIVGKAASHDKVYQFMDGMKKIKGLAEPECSYSKILVLLTEYEIIVPIKNDIPQQLNVDK